MTLYEVLLPLDAWVAAPCSCAAMAECVATPITGRERGDWYILVLVEYLLLDFLLGLPLEVQAEREGGGGLLLAQTFA